MTTEKQSRHPSTERVVEQSVSAEGLIVDEGSKVPPVLSVVLPTLNEEEGVGTCIEWIKTAVEQLEVPTEIIISDASTDQTPQIARQKGAIVVNPDKAGYGYAYRYGFNYARGQYIAMGDADMTYDFKQLPLLVNRLVETNADMVIGSRFQGEIQPGAMPVLHQYIGNPILTKFLNVFYGVGVSDAHSGFRVFKRELLEDLDLKTTGMEFASEMIMEAGTQGLTIEEVPITYRERVGEATLESFRDGWRHVRFMLKNTPKHLFSLPGIILGIFGSILMAGSLFSINIGGTAPGIRSMIFGGVLVIVGYQTVSFSLFSALATDPIRSPNDPITRWLHKHLTLERGAAAGLMIFVGGVAYAIYLIGTWVMNGYSSLPLVVGDIAAFILIALGAQTVFMAFFIDMLRDSSLGMR